MVRKRLNQAANAPVAQWIEQRFPKPRAHVRFMPGASLCSCAPSIRGSGLRNRVRHAIQARTAHGPSTRSSGSTGCSTRTALPSTASSCGLALHGCPGRGSARADRRRSRSNDRRRDSDDPRKQDPGGDANHPTASSGAANSSRAAQPASGADVGDNRYTTARNRQRNPMSTNSSGAS